MRTASLMLALLVAAALAGCLGGSDNQEQPLEDGQPSDGTTTAPPTTGTGTRGPGLPPQHGSVDAYLQVSASNGTAPLNVTLTFGVNSTIPPGAQGQGSGQGNGTGQPGNGTGQGQGSNGTAQGNATSNPGTSPGQSARGSDDELTWTLEVHFTASSGGSDGNATGGSTGNQTGNATGNQTGTGTSTATGTGSANATGTNGTQTTGSPAGNGTNQTGADGNATAIRTLFASWNGTGDDLPGNRTLWLNETGTYESTFTVHSDNETAAVRTQSVEVAALPPGSPLGNETTTFKGNFLASPLLVCIASNDHEWILNTTFENRSAAVSHVNITATGSGLSARELFLLDEDGNELASGPGIHAEGPFEAGTYTVRVESCVAANASYTVTAIANYAVPEA